MEDDAIALVEKIRDSLTERDRLADAVYDYFTANEFNTIFMLQSCLAVKSQCYLLDEMSLHFKNTLYFWIEFPEFMIVTF